MKEPEREPPALLPTAGAEVSTAPTGNTYVDAVEAGMARLIFPAPEAAGAWTGFAVPTAAIQAAAAPLREGAWLVLAVSGSTEKTGNHLVERGPERVRIHHHEAHGPRRVFELPAALVPDSIAAGGELKIVAEPGTAPRELGDLRKRLGSEDSGGDLSL